jgi:hypothetical protein
MLNGFRSLGEVMSNNIRIPRSGFRRRHRLSTCYFARAKAADSLAVWDEADNRFAKDPIFPNSLVSTAAD